MSEKGANLAFYLKYRPQTLSDLVGQQQVVKTLQSAYLSKKLSHAYLLHGPRGTGKTSLARILAKMVNCESGTSEIPCNHCSTCLSITDGSNLDLIEIDAASNRGIEDIRSLREKIKLVPTSSKKKVYIIDEVHMLTPEAFNGLLKTLEEPPSHALFILATTDMTKIPPTILSRTQRLDFQLANQQQILQILDRIVKAEKINIEEEALKILAKKADGSFRDGVKLLDQVASLGEKITATKVLATLQFSRFDDCLSLIQDLADRKTTACLRQVDRQIANGVDAKKLTLELLDLLRSLMLIKNGVGSELIKPNRTEENYQKLTDLADKFSSNDLVCYLDVLQQAFERLKFASIPQLPLELAIVEICKESSAQPSSEIAKLPMLARNDDTKEAIDSYSDQSATSDDILKLKEKWTFVLETIRPYNFSLEALLRSANITNCTDSEVLMEVPYSFHQRILEAPKNRDLLEGILSDILGRSIHIKTLLGNRPAKEDIVNVEVAADDEIIRVAAEIFESESVN